MRAYDTEHQIWDAMPGCEHDWVERKSKLHAGRGDKGQKAAKYSEQAAVPDRIIFDATCTKCSAWRGELGQEPTSEMYIKHLVQIFDEVKRVLTKTGVCYVNIGDKIDDGDAELIPYRFALQMKERGWKCKRVLIWHKPDAMPSSDKRGFSVDYEPIFMFYKQKDYFFETQYEPHHMRKSESLESEMRRTSKWGKKFRPSKLNVEKYKQASDNTHAYSVYGRIKRSVWSILTAKFPHAHFAVMPVPLVEIMLKSGCPQEICSKCHTPRKIVYKEIRVNTRPGNNVGTGKSGTDADPNKSLHKSDLSKFRQQIFRVTGYKSEVYTGKAKKDYKAAHAPNPSDTKRSILKSMFTPKIQELTDCGCNAGWYKGTVLDPFFGAGSTGLAALKNHRDFVGIELNGEYIKIAQERLQPYKEQKDMGEF